MNLKIFLIFVAFLVATTSVKGQIRVSLKTVTINDSITVYYNPTLGNNQLAGTNPIYIYTGLIMIMSRFHAACARTPNRLRAEKSFHSDA